MSTRTTGARGGWTVVRVVPCEVAPEPPPERMRSHRTLALGLGLLAGVACGCAVLWKRRTRHDAPTEAAHA